MKGHGIVRMVGIWCAAALLPCLFACASPASDARDLPASAEAAWTEAETPAPTIAPALTTAPPTPSPSPYVPETLTVRFVGDIMVSRAMTDGAEQPGGTFDFNPVWSRIRGEFSGADLVIGNLETPVAGYENGKFTGFPRFNAPDEYLDAIKNAGVNVLTNANNHLLDRGVEGALTTVEKIRARGFYHTGVYASPDEERILIIPVRGVKVALLAYSYRQADKEKPKDKEAMAWLTNFNDPEQMADDIFRAREMGADVVLVFTHMGKEGTYEPSRFVVGMAEHLANSGADAAIFCHSHAVQPFNRIHTADGRDVFVAYALGNFLCDGKYTMSRSGMILELPITFDRERHAVEIHDVCYVPTYSHGEPADYGKEFTLYAAGVAMDDETLPSKTRNLARISYETVLSVVGEEYALAVRSFAE